MKEYLTTKEVAEEIGYKESTLRTYRYNKQGPPFYKLGGKVLYKSSELRAWIEGGQFEQISR